MEEKNQIDQQTEKPNNTGVLWAILIIAAVIAGGVLVYQSQYSETSGILLTAQVRTAPDGDEEVVLDSVTIPSEGGFVILYEENDDGSRTIVGQSSFLPGGEHSNVVVPLTKEASARRFQRRGTNQRAAKYLVVTHQDDGDQVFDEAGDGPYVDENGQEISSEVLLEEDEIEEPLDTSGTGDSGDTEGTDTGGEGTELPPAEEGMSEEEMEDPTISYTDDGFSPGEITVSVGDTVTWVNDSTRDVWPATAQHPTHTVYPGSDIDKCGTADEEGILDSCGGVEPGDSWSFTFDEAGEWGYHDHLRASEFGKVIVE